MQTKAWFGAYVLMAVVAGTLPARAQEKAQEKGTPASPPKNEEKVEKVDRPALEKALEQQLSGCQLVGFFTVVPPAGQALDAKPPREEKYTITQCKKLQDDYWLLAARIQYGKYDVTVPMTLRILWAGDTPVITLTDFTIPGLGTFTARVMIYGDRYAGTWQHGKSGGHMWGRVEKLAKEKEEQPKAEEPPAQKPNSTTKP